MKKYALLSVSDKTNIIAFASTLVSHGYHLISTGGTLKTLQEVSLPVTAIQEVTGFPEMMDGRVKTLHPAIHAGLLAKRDNPDHLSALNTHQFNQIDVVVVNLYPFEASIANENTSLAEAIEKIDIGGPSMIRSAAKNHASVAVVVNPKHYNNLAKELDENQGSFSLATKQKLAVEAFQHTTYYDGIIAQYFAKAYQTAPFPEEFSLPLKKKSSLRYGENPHQAASIYKLGFDPTALSDIEQLHGKDLSYNNYVDLDAAWQIVSELKKPAVAIIKHTNPCGAAIADRLSEAYTRAFDADPVSAFGSIIAVNRNLDAETAEKMSKLFVEAIIAPEFSSEALNILQKKKNIRLIKHKSYSNLHFTAKHIDGAVLLQEKDNSLYENLNCVTQCTLNKDQEDDIHFAFCIAKHVKSNAIVLVKDGVTIGVGAGQMSRIEAVEIALKKAGDKSKGSICASDAFFPFGDSVTHLAAAGVETVVQPGGSVKDQESIDAANSANICMLFTGQRHFKH